MRYTLINRRTSMGRIRNIELSSEARKSLEEGYRTGKSHAFRQRCQIMLLKSEGRSSEEVAGIVKCCEVVVNNWLTRFEQEGIVGLKTKAGRGRKATLKQTDVEAVKRAVRANRQRLKIAKAELEQDLGKEFSLRTLQRFLKSLTQNISELEKG